MKILEAQKHQPSKEQQTNTKLDELVDAWARGKAVSTADFFWMVDTIKKLSSTEAKYESLVSMFDTVTNMTVGAWETMLADQEK